MKGSDNIPLAPYIPNKQVSSGAMGRIGYEEARIARILDQGGEKNGQIVNPYTVNKLAELLPMVEVNGIIDPTLFLKRLKETRTVDSAAGNKNKERIDQIEKDYPIFLAQNTVNKLAELLPMVEVNGIIDPTLFLKRLKETRTVDSAAGNKNKERIDQIEKEFNEKFSK